MDWFITQIPDVLELFSPWFEFYNSCFLFPKTALDVDIKQKCEEVAQFTKIPL